MKLRSSITYETVTDMYQIGPFLPKLKRMKQSVYKRNWLGQELLILRLLFKL